MHTRDPARVLRAKPSTSTHRPEEGDEGEEEPASAVMSQGPERGTLEKEGEKLFDTRTTAGLIRAMETVFSCLLMSKTTVLASKQMMHKRPVVRAVEWSFVRVHMHEGCGKPRKVRIRRRRWETMVSYKMGEGDGLRRRRGDDSAR